MKTLETIQKLAKIGKILSKIVFIFSIIGGVCCVVGLSLAWLPESIKIGDLTLKSIIDKNADFSLGACYAAMISGLAFCAGEAVLSKMAENLFKFELEKGTPFDFDVAKRMLKLGITLIWVPIVAMIISAIGYAIIKNTLGGVQDMDNDGFSQFAIGIAFIITSLLCKLGAEKNTTDNS